MSGFSLLLFSVEPDFIREAVAGGVTGIVVDWEHTGKERRQAASDTEINHQTLDDLKRVRASTDARVVCRINGVNAETAAEVELAIGAGVDEILIPMVRDPADVTRVLELVHERCSVSILVETDAAVRRIADLSRLPLARLYMGLNDLSIDRGTSSIFQAVADGTVETVRRHVSGAFGFAGLTLPEAGQPVPCRLLMAEMARLGCTFSMLRRSFRRDTRGRDVRRETERILQAVAAQIERTPDEIERDRKALLAVIGRLTEGNAAASRSES